MQNVELIEEEDYLKFKKGGVGILRNLTFSLMLGVFANV
jgi:hypothetical protein